jgi:hypothetical protein
MATRTLLARASVSIFLAAGVLAAAQNCGEAQEAGKVGPPLETVKAFGDDFRLFGIGVTAKGSVFATAPSSDVRSRFSMIEVDQPARSRLIPMPPGTISVNKGEQVGMDFRAGAVGRQIRSSVGARLVLAEVRSGALAAEAGRVRPV